jgi:glycosyltransferase involved in cell wall biosynthesis
MSETIGISVVIRTIGQVEWLTAALESLARQSTSGFEVVVVDMSGGSIGPLIARCRAMLPRLQHLEIGRVLTRPVALNHGIAHAASDKVAILDEDDVYDPRHVEVLVRGLEQTSADLVYTGVRRTALTPDGEVLATAVWHRPFDLSLLLVGNYIQATGIAFWKRTWERLGGFDPRFEVGEDLDFLLRLSRDGRIVCLPDVTAETRSFTGDVSVRNHEREARTVRRARAGLYWRHRHLFLRERKRIACEYFDSDGRLAMRSRRPLWQRVPNRIRLMVALIEWWWMSTATRR